MELLQVRQDKALKVLHEGGDPVVLKELQTATDLVLWAKKVTTCLMGHAMSKLLVQVRHLCLCLVDMRDTDKTLFLNSPMSQSGLFDDTVKRFA